ncbi:MAG: serpin family protein [Bacteroides sp.]|nr:serpin family protein [Bacteroides sp.]
MGVETLFGYNSLPDIAQDLSCDLIRQSTKLEVSEAGAKAAAVIDVIVVAYGVAEKKPAPVVVNVNYPFIFSITATDYNIVLFAGAIYKI